LRQSSLHNTLPSILVSSPHRCAAAGSLADVQLQSSPLPPYSHPQQQSCTTRTCTDWLTTPHSAALLLLFLSSMQHAQSVYASPQCSSCPPPIDTGSSHVPTVTRLPLPSSRPAHRSCSLAPLLYCSCSAAPSFAVILPLRSSSPPLSSSRRSVAAAARPQLHPPLPATPLLPFLPLFLTPPRSPFHRGGTNKTRLLLQTADGRNREPGEIIGIACSLATGAACCVIVKRPTKYGELTPRCATL